MCLLMICDEIYHSKCLLFAEVINNYRAIKSREDCNLLQTDINSIQGWYTTNYMELITSETYVISISFSRKTKLTDL
jgi:hypothetical protein